MREFRYRPDVDGLRALAVLLVVFYHAGLGWCGGFIGVDVFFVISGFLITGLILKEQEARTFCLRAFWLRRIRRILPASIVMMLGTLILGAIVLFPADYRELAHSAIAQQFMASNVFFWKNAGYFAGAAESKPLLHTWSLAVEEQFYLGYPFLLILLSRTSRRVSARWLTTLALTSFALSQWGVHAYPRATFFLLPTRAWEMLAGGLIWFAPARKLAPRAAGLLSWLALSGILLSGWLYDSGTPFPGFAAIVPCLATVVLIYVNADQQTRVASLLSVKPVVFIGLISYSLYLWHWPLLVFARYGQTHSLPNAYRFFILLLSGLLAYLSWRFVETPWRQPSRSSRAVLVFSIGAVGTILIACVGIALNEGVPARFDDRTRRLLATMENREFRNSVPLADVHNGDLPEFGDANGATRLLVWGDSHAMALVPTIHEVCRARKVRGVQATHSSTLPLLKFTAGRKWEAAASYGDAVLEYVRKNGIEVVVLAGYWSRDSADPRFSGCVRNTTEALLQAGCRVIVVRDIPEQRPNPRGTVIAAILENNNLSNLGVSLGEHRHRQATADRVLLNAQRENVIVVDPAPFLVDSAGRCRLVVNGECLYRNEDHLSVCGASRLFEMFDEGLGRLERVASTETARRN